jgi:hypothetical protein
LGHWRCELSLAYAIHRPERGRSSCCLAAHVDDRGWHTTYGRPDADREPPLDFAYLPNMDANRALNEREGIHPQALLRRSGDIRANALVTGVRISAFVRPNNSPTNAHRPLRTPEGADHHLWLTHKTALGQVMKDFLAAGAIELPLICAFVSPGAARSLPVQR